MTGHPEETAEQLIKTDPQLKTLPVTKYGQLASEASIAKTKAALEAKTVRVQVFEKGSQALQWIKDNIPSKKTVGNAHSTTLEQIGFVEHLKTQTAWDNLHAKIFAEPDQSKHGDLYKKMQTADYFFTSATAVSEEGDITAADLTGTKTGAFNYNAGHLVVICGTHKIVPTFADAIKRTEEYCLPLESARARIAYKVPGSAINNFVAIRGHNPFAPGPRVTVLFVKEALGY